MRKRLVCSCRQKKEFLTQLEDELFLFSGETEDADWNALVTRFGTPENTADEFMTSLEPDRQRRFLRRRNWAVAAVCTVLVLGMTLSLLYAFQCKSYLNNIHYVESITRKSDTLPEITAPTYDYYEFSSEDSTGEASDEK